jgi:hypothetical protein
MLMSDCYACEGHQEIIILLLDFPMTPIGFSHDLLIIMPNSMEQRFEKAGQNLSCSA